MHTRCEDMLKHCSSIHVEHDAQALLEQCSTNEPYVLTNKFGLLEHQTHVSNARRGAARFGSLGDEKSRPASAARGLDAVSNA